MQHETEQLSLTLQNIKQMMERSSRFISLSGLSGISAGICAFIGSYFANEIIEHKKDSLVFTNNSVTKDGFSFNDILHSPLLQIAVVTFCAALISAFIFTYIRSKQNNIPIWGFAARRLMFSVAVPLVAGAMFILKLLDNNDYGLIAPGCLIFYGIALLNGSKHTLSEVKYLGYAEIILGIINLFFIRQGLYFWIIGFGALHIIYGIFMWQKYERN